MRLSVLEKKGLKSALSGFDGDIYLFGSRVDNKKKGGDVDILLVANSMRYSAKDVIKIQNKFMKVCEQSVDIILYIKNDPFCEEALKSGKKLDIKNL